MKSSVLCRFIFVAVLWSGWTCDLAAQSSREALKNLQAAMQREVDNKPSNETEPSLRLRHESARMMLGQIAAAAARDERGQSDQLLAQTPAYFGSDDVRKQAAQLTTLLRQEREAKDAATVNVVNAALKRAGEAVPRAKEPRDLDAIIAELARLRSDDQTRDSDAVRRFVPRFPRRKISADAATVGDAR